MTTSGWYRQAKPSSLGRSLHPFVAHAKEFQHAGQVFRASYLVARCCPAVGEGRVGSCPPGPDQLVSNLPRETEVRVAVVVDVPDLLTAQPVSCDAYTAGPILVPLLPDPRPAQELALKRT